MLRTLFAAASPAGTRARLSILIFHRVLPEPDPLFPGEIDVRAFDAICSWLAAWVRVLPLDEAVSQMASGTLPARAACITFDDGYADNHDLALPILRRHGLTATFFVASGFLGGGRMFNDTVIEAVRRTTENCVDLRGTSLHALGTLDVGSVQAKRRAVDVLLPAVKYLVPGQRDAAVAEVVVACGSPALPDDLMMSCDQVCTLHRSGMGIGGHTRTHPILTRLEAAALHAEIAGGRADLEGITGGKATLFAYPNGKPGEDYDAKAIAAVRAAGFTAALSTSPGVADARSDRFQLPRFTPWDRSRIRFGLRLLGNLRSPRPQLAPA